MSTSASSKSKAPGAKAEPKERADPAVRVLRQFRQVFNAVKTHLLQVEKTVGLGGAQVWR